ncbi:MAG TPA: rod shape-determining protein RodA [Gaiellaceae bacterium]|nr:rod shape-determining protein RodA [Gaiellaceae bacterium]
MAMVEASSPAQGARAVERPDVLELVRRLDWLLFGAVLGLVGFGLWAIAGITRHDVADDPDHFVVRQAIFAAAGAVGFAAALFVDPALYRRFRKPIYVGTIGLMVLVIATAGVTRGSRRWIDVGFFQLQPSEFGKLLFLFAIGGFLADRSRRIGEWGTVWRAVALGLAPTGLVFVQPDLGTALVYGAVLAAVLFVSGVRWLHLAVLGALAVLAAAALLWALPAAGVEVLKPYQTARIAAFTDREGDPAGATYNVNQSITAVGAGGLRGRGVDGSTQTRFDYLPEHATDFVFASLAEQRGFVGAGGLLLLYLLLLWRGIRIVSLARDPFSAAVAGGIVFWFLFQIFVNVGMTMGIAPITGIPLPFISVGGSSMVTSLLAMGVLQAIHLRAAGRRG